MLVSEVPHLAGCACPTPAGNHSGSWRGQGAMRGYGPAIQLKADEGELAE